MKLLNTLIMLLVISFCSAQKETAIWYFGANAGLDFNTGSPVSLQDGQINTSEGVASIADALGKLLFYTNGVTVFSKNHAVMENGAGLMGTTTSSQSAIIVPRPNTPGHYYIFTVTYEEGIGLRYSEVDMSADNGLGAITALKNSILAPHTTEHLSAVVHANGNDIWVVAHSYGNNTFMAFLVTEAGVDSNPVTSSIGPSIADTDVIGYLKASPYGTKLGMCNYDLGVTLFDFDPATALVSNPVIVSAAARYYGLEFSPSGKLLYASNKISAVRQFNLEAVDISASETEIMPPNQLYRAAALQLGPDGKIYFSNNLLPSLSVIHNPNIAGMGCNFEVSAISLNGKTATLGLPNYIASQFLEYEMEIVNNCPMSATQFSIALPYLPTSVSWDFGDGSSAQGSSVAHNYQSSGQYTATATVTRGGIHYKYRKTLTIVPPPTASAPEDLVLCGQGGSGQELFDLESRNGAILGDQQNDLLTVSYYLNQADAYNGVNSLAGKYTNATNPQTIYARVTDTESGCYATTSFKIIVAPIPEIAMPDQYLVCEGRAVTLSAPDGYSQYRWSTGQNTPDITVRTPGMYTLTVWNTVGQTLCHSSKQITVRLALPPVILDIKVAEWTDNANTITVVTDDPQAHEYSLDDISYQNEPIFKNLTPGYYKVYVRNKIGCGKAMAEAVLLMYPRFFTPNADGLHDKWRIKFGSFAPGLTVYIFDRYGKLLQSMQGEGPGWDGTLDGSALPAADYWFLAVSPGREYRGHFSLMR